ncbi:hypothetical protein V5799_033898 [Amblyomma americanum]|uniref:Uncharacterized protein n=1 Tax=Amblyomma americanum TaxID=6943 RepID=A0AAQ4DM02_AMBAM
MVCAADCSQFISLLYKSDITAVTVNGAETRSWPRTTTERIFCRSALLNAQHERRSLPFIHGRQQRTAPLTCTAHHRRDVIRHK